MTKGGNPINTPIIGGDQKSIKRLMDLGGRGATGAAVMCETRERCCRWPNMGQQSAVIPKPHTWDTYLIHTLRRPEAMEERAIGAFKGDWGVDYSLMSRMVPRLMRARAPADSATSSVEEQWVR